MLPDVVVVEPSKLRTMVVLKPVGTSQLLDAVRVSLPAEQF